MKLTTMKISVPVLMLMMFQSGYGVSDWFGKASIAVAAEGNPAKAFAIVQEARPEKAPSEALSDKVREDFQKKWTADVVKAVKDVLPSYYSDDIARGDDATGAGQALLDSIITVNASEIINGGQYDNFVHHDVEATKNAVNGVVTDRIVKLDTEGAYSVITAEDHSWLLQDEDYDLDGTKGIGAWAEDILYDWKYEPGQQDFNKDLLKAKNENGITLRGDTNGEDPVGIDLKYEDSATEVNTVYEKIKDKAEAGAKRIDGVQAIYEAAAAVAKAAKDVAEGSDPSVDGVRAAAMLKAAEYAEADTKVKEAANAVAEAINNSQEADPTDVADAADDIVDGYEGDKDEVLAVEAKIFAPTLRSALEDVLAERINALINLDNSGEEAKAQLGYYVSTHRDRVVTDGTSETIIDYGSTNTPEKNPLTVILGKAGTAPTVDSISSAIDKIITDDLTYLLRRNGSVSIDALDTAIGDVSVENNVKKGLQSVAQTFSDAAASSVVSELKALKKNQ